MRCEKILAWGKYYFPDKFNKSFCSELHDYLASIRKEMRTNTLAPRGYAKTTIKCFLIPLYQALNEPEKFNHYLNIQATSSKAVSVNLTIRQELESNELLRRDYGDQVNDEKWTEKQFVLKNGVVFTAIGAGDSVRGINYRNRRPDYIVIDDLYDEDDIYSVDRVMKKTRWFWSSIYPALSKDGYACIHIQGTAIHKEDLIHQLIGKEGWVFRKFQAITDEDKKLVLWPEVETYEKLLADKELMGSIIFMREYQNELRDDENSIIKEADIRYYNGELPGDQTVVKKIGACDPAIGEKKTNDFTAKAYVKRTNLHNWYIHEIKEDKMSFNANLKDIENWHERVVFHTFRIEEISAFQIFGQELIRTSGVPVAEIKTVKDKLARLTNQQAKFENGKVFINKQIPKRLRDRLVDQLINNNPAHDDIRDAVVLALEDETTDLYIGVV